MANQSVNQDEQEYKEYLEYLDYQDYVASQAPKSDSPAVSGKPVATPEGQAQAALEGFGQTATAGYLPQLQALAEPTTDKLFNLISGQNLRPQAYIDARDQNIQRQGEQSKQYPGTVLAAKASGIVPSAVLAPAASSIKGAAALGAAQGALYNPGDKEGEMDLYQVGDRLKNAALGASVGGTLQGITKGAGTAADYLQQSAMGVKKMAPGIGTEAIEAGVRGTKTGMQEKIGKAIESQGEKLQKAVANIKGTVDSSGTAKKLLAEANKFRTPSGLIPDSVKPFYDAAVKRAEEIAARGSLPATEQLAIKRIVAKPGYNKFGEPLSQFESKLAQKEGLSLGNALEEAAAKQGNPEKISGLNQSLSKLLKGQTAMSKPEANGVRLTDLAALIGGTTMAGPAGGVGAALGRRALTSPLVQSYGAKILKSGPEWISDQSPFLTEALLEASRKKK